MAKAAMTKTKARSTRAQHRHKRKVALALQGGGSHGAFTWGVLDRILEDETIDIIGVTGASAGAMNAIILADGLLKGGPEEARKQLREFWETVGTMPAFGTMLWPMSAEAHANLVIEETPAYLAWEMLARNLSPSDLNPFNYNPIREPLARMVDFDRLRAEKDLKVMVCATNVLTARRHVFTNGELSVDAVLASACLPRFYPPIEIDGEYYWDGGYTGNPAMTALVNRLPKCDLIIVRIDPIIRKKVPRTRREIHDRVTELSFNTTFWMELSALAVILRFVDEGLLDRKRFGRILFHAIEASREMEKIAASTKLDNAPVFLDYLFHLGRNAAKKWFAHHGEDIGHRSTIDIQKLLPVAD